MIPATDRPVPCAANPGLHDPRRCDETVVAFRDRVRRAATVCTPCPVQDACYHDALKHGLSGIFAGHVLRADQLEMVWRDCARCGEPLHQGQLKYCSVSCYRAAVSARVRA